MAADGGRRLDDDTREQPTLSAGPRVHDDAAPARDDGVDDRAYDERRPSRLRWLLLLVLIPLALVVTGFLGVRALWPGLHNPFADQRHDRSQPTLLKSIQDLSRFVAAEGNFEVVVDLQENRKYLPDFLVNDRTLFVAAGTVEAYVDLGALGEGAITESEDRRTAEIKLPAPQLGPANLNTERSYVFAQQRGLFNRVGDLFDNDPNKLRDLYRLAQEKIGDAARDSGLAQRAEENTRKTLEGMLRSLGYTSVTVTFAAP